MCSRTLQAAVESIVAPTPVVRTLTAAQIVLNGASSAANDLRLASAAAAAPLFYAMYTMSADAGQMRDEKTALLAVGSALRELRVDAHAPGEPSELRRSPAESRLSEQLANGRLASLLAQPCRWTASHDAQQTPLIRHGRDANAYKRKYRFVRFVDITDRVRCSLPRLARAVSKASRGGRPRRPDMALRDQGRRRGGERPDAAVATLSSSSRQRTCWTATPARSDASRACASPSGGAHASARR